MASGDDATEESRPPLGGADAARSQVTDGAPASAKADAMTLKAEQPGQAPVEAEEAPAATEQPAEAVQRLIEELGDALRICILGGTSFQGPDSEKLVQAMAGELAASLGQRTAFVTGGMAGVQKSFALHCGDGSRVWNLLPVGQSSGFGVGRDLHAGADLERRKEVFGLLGELYVTVEGGPGVSQEARAAHARGAVVIPLARTGGASSGMFDFPAAALERPAFATVEQWALLQNGQAPVAEAAAAVAEIVAAFAEAHGASEAPPAKRAKPSPDDEAMGEEAPAREAEESGDAAAGAPTGAPAGDAEAETQMAHRSEKGQGKELGDAQPAGLALCQSPGAPAEQDIGDDDVEHDVEPLLRNRGSAPGTEIEEVSPGGSRRPGKGAGAFPETGENDGAAIPRDLISRELLDELSHEPYDWNEGRHAPTPPLNGFSTPSETRTPSPRGTPRPHQYYGTTLNHEAQQVHNEGLMCIDQWDWKTDAPEFVPGSMKGLMDGSGAYQAWAIAPGAPRGNQDGGGPESARVTQMRAQFDWQLRTKSDELRDMQNRMNQMEIETAQVRASWENERRSLVQQIRHYRAVLERYCIPVEEANGSSFGGADDVNGYYTGFEPSAPSQWGPNGTSVSGGGQGGGYGMSGGYGGGQGGYGGQGSGGGGGGSQQPPGAYGSGPAVGSGAAIEGGGAESAQSSTLDSKMRQLNSLLQEGNNQTRRRSPSDGIPDGGPHSREPKDQGEGMAGGGGGGGYSSGSIASTLRAMFPHATIRTSRAENNGQEKDGAGEEASAVDTAAEVRMVEQHMKKLERSTACAVDERAMRSLNSLCPKDAKEALQKVDDLVHSQGGHCRNLSSILQSVCRKIEKRSSRGVLRGYGEEDTPRAGWSGNGAAATATREAAQATRAAEAAAAAAASGGGSRASGGGGGGSTDNSHSKRVRRTDEDGDAFEDSADSDGEGRAAKDASHDIPPTNDGLLVRTISMQSQGSNLLDTPAGKRSWADIQSGDEDDLGEEQAAAPSNGARPSEEQDEESEHWNAQRIEKAARRGFELRRRGDHWDMKISMGGMDPPLTQAGMERYCRWLRVRLSAFREEHGPEPLRRCRGEVDFSHNNMDNQMVWVLLETLAQFEVHTALLKLFANHISQGGILAICEFIRSNSQAEALHELHLSHNEIDDESALELLRVLHAHRPRYPPRRPCEGTGEYVLAPVWLRLNHNRIRDPEHVRRTAEAEGITVCTAWDRQACGTSKCCRRECPLVHLYSFNVQARRRQQESQWQQQTAPQQPASESEVAWAEEAQGNNGDQRGARRKRNRGKVGSSKDVKKDRDGAAEADAAAGGDGGKGREENREQGADAPPSSQAGESSGSAPPRILRRDPEVQ